MIAAVRYPRPKRRRSKHDITFLSAGIHAFQSYDDWRRVKGCNSKLRYETEEEVIAACISYSRAHGPCRYYRCDTCGGYHLTSQVND